MFSVCFYMLFLHFCMFSVCFYMLFLHFLYVFICFLYVFICFVCFFVCLCIFFVSTTGYPFENCHYANLGVALSTQPNPPQGGFDEAWNLDTSRCLVVVVGFVFQGVDTYHERWMFTHDGSMEKLYIYLHENHENQPNVGEFCWDWYIYLHLVDFYG